MKEQVLTKKTLGKRVAEHWIAYLMVLPAVVWYIVWNYFPMYGILIAFKDYSIFKGVFKSEWVGLKNFIEFFSSPYAWRVIRNTITINLYSLVTIFPLTIILALLLNEIRIKWFKSGVQTMLYLPHFISTVVVAGIVVTFLSPSSGIVNIIIAAFGGEKTYFLTKAKYFKPIYLIMSGWQGIGFGTILYTAALSGIDESLYEAARLDGASKLRQIWHVTLPGLIPTYMVMLLMAVAGCLSNGLDQYLVFSNAMNKAHMEVLDLYVYNLGIDGGSIPLSTVIGMAKSIVSVILLFIANSISKAVRGESIV